MENYTTEDGLYNNFIKDIAIDDNGNIWACEYADYLAEGSVTVYNGTNWTIYSVDDGLVDVLVKKIKIDNDGDAWISTGNGVSKSYNFV